MFEGESDAESIYESRKLLIRQVQAQIAKQVHNERDSVSEYDSWSDLEDNFALAYEPIPLNIKLETWRRMSKKEILGKVKSKKVRRDFESMSHSEIVAQIEKMQKNALYLSSKFGISHLMPHIHDIHENNDNQDDTEVSEDNVSVAESFVSGREIYLSRSEIVNKLHQSKNDRQHVSVNKSAQRSRETRAGEVPITGDNHEAGVTSERGKLNSARKSSHHNHDSWSSRASSILKVNTHL